MQTTELPAGRELDALIAGRVFGLPVVQAPWSPAESVLLREEIGPGGKVQSYYPIKPYSTDIAAAWYVVGALQHAGVVLDLHTFGTDGWRVTAHYERDGTWRKHVEYSEGSLPAAICYAGLVAVGAH